MQNSEKFILSNDELLTSSIELIYKFGIEKVINLINCNMRALSMPLNCDQLGMFNQLKEILSNRQLS
jgi:hypothetical protein